MTAIAGVAGGPATVHREILTRALLEEQRLYGSASTSLLSVEHATFGVSPFRGLPTTLVSAEGLLLTADIRLDNRGEIAERVGRTARDCSDADLLLAAWIKGGEQSLSWIAGEFALAIFDDRNQSLILARDISGQTPLFFARSQETVAFASMPTALRPFLGPLQLNRLSLSLLVCDAGDVDEHSCFERVERLLPGQMVRINAAGANRRIYWGPPRPSETSASRADLIDEYRHLLDTAVGDRLKDCSRPVGSHLSSGWDSSAIVGTAARLLTSTDQLVAFTSAPNATAPIPAALRRNADESPVAAQTASRYGIRHVIVRDTPPIIDTIRRQSLLSQEPIISAPNMAWLVEIRRQAAAMGIDCLLIGSFGNATLNVGGLYVLSEWIRRKHFMIWLREARAAARRPDTRWRGVLFNSFHPWMPEFVFDALRRFVLGMRRVDDVSFLQSEWRDRVQVESRSAPSAKDLHAQRVRSILTRDRGMFRKGALADSGVDERDPMADRRLIEFSLRLSPEQLYSNGVPRPLARQALSDRVPKAVLDLPRRGLQAADWALRFTHDDALAVLEEISTSSTVQDLFDLERMRNAIHKWPTRDWNRYSIIAEYRTALIGALATGMFALAHEQEQAAKRAPEASIASDLLPHELQD